MLVVLSLVTNFWGRFRDEPTEILIAQPIGYQVYRQIGMCVYNFKKTFGCINTWNRDNILLRWSGGKLGGLVFHATL